MKELNHFREMQYNENATEIKLFSPDSILSKLSKLLN